MKNNRFSRFSRVLTNQKGATAILIAILLPVLLGFGALAIDVGYMYATKNELQNIADAAALAGAGELGQIYLEADDHISLVGYLDEEKKQRVYDAAIAVAEKNFAAGQEITINLGDGSPDDVFIGYWTGEEGEEWVSLSDWNTWASDPENSDYAHMIPNAVRVIVINTTPVTLFLAQIFAYFDGDHGGTFDAAALATAALSGITTIKETGFIPPIAISNQHLCGEIIKFSPTGESCAGWHTYRREDIRGANADVLRKIMYGFIKEHSSGENGPPEDTYWQDTFFQYDVKTPDDGPYTGLTPPEIEHGHMLEFIGGDVAAMFNNFYYSDWNNEDDPDISSRKPEYVDGTTDTDTETKDNTQITTVTEIAIDSNGTITETKTVTETNLATGEVTEKVNSNVLSYAPFLSLFDYFRFRDDDGDVPFYPCNATDPYDPDEVWTTLVPVFKEPEEGCKNPNKVQEVVDFARVHIIMPEPPPSTQIQVCMSCYVDVIDGPGGGKYNSSILGSVPHLVQ